MDESHPIVVDEDEQLTALGLKPLTIKPSASQILLHLKYEM